MADKEASRGGGGGGGGRDGGRDGPRDRRTNDGKRSNKSSGGRGGGGGGGGFGGPERHRRQRRDRDDKGENAADKDNMERRPIILLANRNSEFPSLQSSTNRTSASEDAAAGGKPAASKMSTSSDSPSGKMFSQRKEYGMSGGGSGSGEAADSPRSEEALSPTSGAAGGAASASADASASSVSSTGAATTTTTSSVQDRCCKLIDDGHLVSEGFMAFLTENTDFTVIGVLGPQSSGKSTLLNHLCCGTNAVSFNAGSDPSEPVNNYGTACGNGIFRVQSFEKQMLAEHCSNGVTAYISPSTRTIFLDCQPVNSASVLDRTIQLEKRYSAEFTHAENTVEMHSLQFAGFLMNVCHVLLFVQDWFVDATMVKFLHTAEMLKPSSPALADEDETSGAVVEYFPKLVFVQNKTGLEDFSPHKLKLMNSFYDRAFAKSQLNVHSGLGMNSSYVMPHMTSLDGSDLNLFVLPDTDCDKSEAGTNGFTSEISYEDVVGKLRATVMSAPRCPMTTTPSAKMTEKMWFHLAQKSWENIKNSSLYMEYNRLM